MKLRKQLQGDIATNRHADNVLLKAFTSQELHIRAFRQVREQAREAICKLEENSVQ